ncbi:MAG TPA: flagellar export chaperone FlgN [Phycisphaerae bacterium]|nr:flagellar export chaperone FlgN [Phycisphaerae bacterium]
MSRGELARLTGELTGLIERLIDQQVVLRGIVHEKLEAMRRCDLDAMLRASRQEGDVTAAVSTLDRRRHELVAQICRLMDFPRRTDVKAVTLRMLADKLESQAGGRLAELADRLRNEMLKLAEANRVVELVCREMMAYFKVLFAAMVQSEHDAPTYSSDGEVGPAAGARVLEAVG